MREPKHPLVMVVWTDTITAPGWKPAEDLDKWVAEQSWLVHSVGYLLKKTDDVIVLAGSWAKNEKHYGSLIKIPRRWAKIIPLTEPDPK